MMINKSVAEKIKIDIKENEPFLPIVIGSSTLSYRQLRDLTEFVRSTGRPVERLYRRPPAGGIFPWIWSGYSDEDVLFNIRLIYQNFVKTYRSLVQINGMDDEVLKRFSRVSKLVVFYSSPRISGTEKPTIEEYEFADGETISEPSVEVLIGPGPQIERHGLAQRTVMFEGKTHRLQGYRKRNVSFLFQGSPMLTLIYETLKRRLDTALA